MKATRIRTLFVRVLVAGFLVLTLSLSAAARTARRAGEARAFCTAK